jgi:pimeloyl-ACP methyl ester carboxylesterase
VSDTDAPWVLLRGLGREAAHWGDFPERLKAALPGATVLTPDLPGCGADLAERPAATVAGLLDRMRRCLAAPGPVHLLGLSLGGMIALEWMRLHPEEVRDAVLINTSAGGVSAPWRRLRPGAAWRLVRAAVARDLAARERHVLAFTSRRPEREAELLASWTEVGAGPAGDPRIGGAPAARGGAVPPGTPRDGIAARAGAGQRPGRDGVAQLLARGGPGAGRHGAHPSHGGPRPAPGRPRLGGRRDRGVAAGARRGSWTGGLDRPAAGAPGQHGAGVRPTVTVSLHL